MGGGACNWNDHLVAGVITASEPSWIGLFTGLSPRCFGKLVTAVRRETRVEAQRGRPWGLSLEDRILLVAAYWRTNLTLRQLAPLYGISTSAADRVTPSSRPEARTSAASAVPQGHRAHRGRHPGPHPRPHRCRGVQELPVLHHRNDCKAWEESGAKLAVGKTVTIADGGYPGTGLVMPHRRRKGEELPAWKEAHNKSHKQVRARVEHAFARMKTWKILRDCRLKGDGVHHAMLGIARLHNLILAG